MNVIEFYPVQDTALNGIFKWHSTDSGEQKRKANDKVDDIKNENGFNDLMYMKPEQAARSLNKILEQLSYNEAWNKKEVGKHRSSTSKKAYQDAAKVFSDASREVMSQFRQYALGMDGEVEKIGDSKKKIDNIEFNVPFYKLILPQEAQNTKPTDSLTKNDLLSIFQSQKGVLPAGSTVIPEKSNTALYVGLGVGALAIAGTAVYLIKSKKK